MIKVESLINGVTHTVKFSSIPTLSIAQVLSAKNTSEMILSEVTNKKNQIDNLVVGINEKVNQASEILYSCQVSEEVAAFAADLATSEKNLVISAKNDLIDKIDGIEPRLDKQKTILNGTVDPPLSLGNTNDFYINTTTKRLFGPKSSTSWGNGISLVGPQGATGVQGPQGVAGATGKSIISNSSDPSDSTLANIGDLFLNTISGTLYEKSSLTQSEFFSSG
ncbi:MAG: hypothetical protein ACK4UP_05555, partial [Spirosomataceae bacterium]